MSIQESKITVWDPFIRFFHWTLVFSIIMTFISEDELLTLHVISGYYVLGLLIARIVWGLIGPKYARFSNFLYSPIDVMRFIKNTFSFKAKRYIGHNPAGGAMILTMMICLLVTVFTGLAVYGAQEQAGPLAEIFSHHHYQWGEWLEEVHEVFANFIVFLVVIHVIGVLVESIIHKENLIISMITGRKTDKF